MRQNQQDTQYKNSNHSNEMLQKHSYHFSYPLLFHLLLVQYQLLFQIKIQMSLQTYKPILIPDSHLKDIIYIFLHSP